MRNVKAILIDPFEKTVTEIEHDADNYRAIYSKLSHETMPVSCFTVVRINDQDDTIFIDDEGLLKPCSHFFVYEGYPQPLAGKGLILGTNEEGDSIAPQAVTVDDVKAKVTFRDDIELSHFEHFDGVKNIAGKEFAVIGNRPIFKAKSPNRDSE